MTIYTNLFTGSNGLEIREQIPTMMVNVPGVGDVFLCPIKECEAFQGTKKCPAATEGSGGLAPTPC
jgi:hypothetical protein